MLQKKPIEVHSCLKHYTYDQDKVCTPEETVERFMKRLKEVNLDILKEVKRIDNGRLDIPVYFSVCGKDAHNTIGTKKQMGKGSTPEQSRASACMELGERFSFFSFLKNKNNFVVGDYKEMKEAGYPVLGIDYLLHSVNDETTSPELLEEFLTGLPMRWTWATNLAKGEEVLVPFSWFFAINEFNGPSAGNTYEEAILQGVSEIIERHVCAVVTRDRIRTPGIDPNSVTDPVARELLDKFKKCGIEVYLNDFTLDTGFPTVGALAYDPSTFPQKSELVYTAGTTPDPTKALIRALTEVAQLAGDFNSGSNYVASGLPKPLSLEEVDYVVRPERMISLDDMADVGHQDMGQEITNLLEVLQKINMEVFLVNTIHDDLKVPAIYTIIPGAQFRERAAGGDAPLFAAKLGADLLDSQELEEKLIKMQKVMPQAYYLDFYRGRNLYDQGSVEDAALLFERALTLSPKEEDLPYVYSYQACCYRDMERYDDAIAALEKGREFDDERPDIHNILGVCHFKKGAYDKAIDHFKRATNLNPVSAIDYANLALNLEKLERTEEAITNYKVALTLDPDIEFARKGLAELLEQQHQEA
ncbi:MAG: YcaO-like family protein [Desulfobulbaceae bacterium]|nr:YcaO-like family protein [Desulfobulbaceae bacterium]